MVNRISNEVKASVLEMFKNGAKKSEIAVKYGISPRSVGRIIDSDKQGVVKGVTPNRTKDSSAPSPAETKSTIKLPLYDITTIGCKDQSAHVGGTYVVQDAVINVMKYIRRELKGVEALTYLVESSDSPEHLELYRQILAQKLKAIGWWQLDAGTVKLGIHRMSFEELDTIHKGERGMKY